MAEVRNYIETAKELPARLSTTTRHTVLPMKLDSPEADLLFTALGNKTRRRILQRLAEQPARSISELARKFNISSTATSKHVDILESASLITRIPHGKYCQIQLASEIPIFWALESK